jgi:hypothetical protein
VADEPKVAPDAPQKAPEGPKEVAKEAPKLPTRDEMKEKLIGKLHEEVLKLLGTPSRTFDSGAFSYSKVTIDPITNKVDASIFVHFTKAKTVSKVHFTPSFN